MTPALWIILAAAIIGIAAACACLAYGAYSRSAEAGTEPAPRYQQTPLKKPIRVFFKNALLVVLLAGVLLIAPAYLAGPSAAQAEQDQQDDIAAILAGLD